MPHENGGGFKLCGLTQSDCIHPICWFTLSYTINCPRNETSAKGKPYALGQTRQCACLCDTEIDSEVAHVIKHSRYDIIIPSGLIFAFIWT